MPIKRMLPLVVLFAAGCGGGMPALPRLADVPLDQAQGQVAALEGGSTIAPEPQIEDRPRGGLLGFFDRRARGVETPDSVPQDTAPETEQASETAAQTDLAALSATEGPTAEVTPQVAAQNQSAEAQTAEAQTAEAPTSEAQTARRGGLLGLFRNNRGSESAGTQLAALPQPNRTDAAPRGIAPGPEAPDYAQIGPGETLPYGEIARQCGVPQRILGRQVDKAPARGRGFTLHDTAPGTTGAHTFFLTGFDDGCARQFTAALVLFSSPETYEQLRFGAPGKNLPKSSTDSAYDRLKSRVCRVAANEPCGTQVSRLARNTVFVSVYERVGSNPKWKTILLHDGEVLAMDLKS